MAMLTVDNLRGALPHARVEDVTKYASFLDEALAQFDIDSPARVAAFLAQVAHESGNLRNTVENLNYSWQGLRGTWPKRFLTDAFAQQYHRQPEKIANYVYANRNGNGDEPTGDGWRYRGRGFIQVTGRANYTAYAVAVGEPTVITEPDLVATPRHAALSAGWFWASHGLNALADVGDEASFNEITRRINGGFNGKEDRLAHWAVTRTVFV